MFALIPLPYKIGVLACLFVAVGLFGYERGSSHIKDQWKAAKAAETASINESILKRVAENEKKAAEQSAINSAITKAKNEELAPVVAAIAADRVRIGPALCPGRFTAPAKTESPGVDHAADTGAGVVSPELESRIRELEIRVEEALATGRSCQKWVTDNGFAP